MILDWLSPMQVRVQRVRWRSGEHASFFCHGDRVTVNTLTIISYHLLKVLRSSEYRTVCL
jgi:hypothetical protein